MSPILQPTFQMVLMKKIVTHMLSLSASRHLVTARTLATAHLGLVKPSLVCNETREVKLCFWVLARAAADVSKLHINTFACGLSARLIYGSPGF